MRVVAGLADTAIDSLAEDDEGATPNPGCGLLWMWRSSPVENRRCRPPSVGGIG